MKTSRQLPPLHRQPDGSYLATARAQIETCGRVEASVVEVRIFRDVNGAWICSFVWTRMDERAKLGTVSCSSLASARAAATACLAAGWKDAGFAGWSARQAVA